MITPGIQAYVGQVKLGVVSIMFKVLLNFWNNTMELLTFCVIDFLAVINNIMEWLCLIKHELLMSYHIRCCKNKSTSGNSFENLYRSITWCSRILLSHIHCQKQPGFDYTCLKIPQLVKTEWCWGTSAEENVYRLQKNIWRKISLGIFFWRTFNSFHKVHKSKEMQNFKISW